MSSTKLNRYCLEVSQTLFILQLRIINCFFKNLNDAISYHDFHNICFTYKHGMIKFDPVEDSFIVV